MGRRERDGGRAIGLPEGTDAVLLDIGGVMVIPDLGLLADELRPCGLALDVDDHLRAHYFGMAALDDVPFHPAAWRVGYVEGALDGLRLAGAARARAGAALVAARALSDLDLWRWPIPGAEGALRGLARAGVALAFVSNSDGTAEEKLRVLGISQVGPGPGVPVAAVVDSAAVGSIKPDPAIFGPALAAVDAEPERTLYVGDSRAYDVAGAQAAGLVPVHIDPYRLCPQPDDHAHVDGLVDVLGAIASDARAVGVRPVTPADPSPRPPAGEA